VLEFCSDRPYNMGKSRPLASPHPLAMVPPFGFSSDQK
jgi:hypothetical protein